MVGGRHQESTQRGSDSFGGGRQAFFAGALRRVHGISLHLRGHSFWQLTHRGGSQYRHPLHLAVTSLVVVGILMAGWSSNNKWSLLGGMRSAAQIVSYEIPAGLSILTIVFLAGTMSMQGIIKSQGWAPWDWFLFNNPFTFVAFFLYFTAALAEGNRTPFDIPEAESELVAGYVTEYSGMRFLFFFFAEWGNLYVIGAVATTLFLGGWQVPPITSDPILLGVLEFVVFFLKAYLWVFIAMWVRATLPRVRVDQLMALCWKYMVPLSFLCLLGTVCWM